MPERSTAKPVTPHSILSSELEKLCSELASAQISPQAKAHLDKCLDLAGGLDAYLDQVSSQPSEQLAHLESETRSTDWDGEFEKKETELHLEQEMISGGLEGQFLKLVVQISQPKRVLEIGSFTGYSALAMAEGLPEGSQITGCEYDPYAAEFARRHFERAGLSDRIKILEGDANESIANLGEVYDLVFIDADKQGYEGYYKALFNNGLVESGSLILIDNSLYQGEVYSKKELSENGHAVRKFNEFVAQDERTSQVLLPLRDGVTLVRVN